MWSLKRSAEVGVGVAVGAFSFGVVSNVFYCGEEREHKRREEALQRVIEDQNRKIIGQRFVLENRESHLEDSIQRERKLQLTVATLTKEKVSSARLAHGYMTARDKLRVVRANVQRSLNQVRAERDESAARVTGLEAQVGEWKEAFHMQGEELLLAKHEVLQTHLHLDALTHEKEVLLDESNERVEALEAVVEEAKAVRLVATQQLVAVTVRKQRLQQELDRVEQETGAIVTELKASDGKLEAANERIHLLEAANEGLVVRAQELNDVNNVIRVHKELAFEDCQKLEIGRDQAEERCEALAVKCDELRMEVAEEKAARIAAEGNLMLRLQQLEALAVECDGFRAEAAKESARRIAAEGSLAALTRRSQQCEIDLRTAVALTNTRSVTIVDLLHKAEDLEKSLVVSNTALDAEKAVTADLAHKLKWTSLEVKEKVTELADSQLRFEYCEQSRADVAERACELEKELASMKERYITPIVSGVVTPAAENVRDRYLSIVTTTTTQSVMSSPSSPKADPYSVPWAKPDPYADPWANEAHTSAMAGAGTKSLQSVIPANGVASMVVDEKPKAVESRYVAHRISTPPPPISLRPQYMSSPTTTSYHKRPQTSAPSFSRRLTRQPEMPTHILIDVRQSIPGWAPPLGYQGDDICNDNLCGGRCGDPWKCWNFHNHKDDKEQAQEWRSTPRSMRASSRLYKHK